jgi:hypothetical protein
VHRQAPAGAEQWPTHEAITSRNLELIAPYRYSLFIPSKKRDPSPPLPTLLAIRTQPIEIEPVADDLVTRQFCHLLVQIVHKTHLGVHNLSAAHTNKMRMGIRPAAIVTIVVFAEAELKHFAQLLQEISLSPTFLERRSLSDLKALHF